MIYAPEETVVGVDEPLMLPSLVPAHLSCGRSINGFALLVVVFSLAVDVKVVRGSSDGSGANGIRIKLLFLLLLAPSEKFPS